ncbi:hypothetical protein ALP8811_01937 [Aliiroseovarius pelagivivens]|uniref:Uncharacterized protein n=1 Tax=Aliiroseovarius pelagivivens TaxID=1639690 RepID=A0A2R8ALP1_9RHOB|nr:hypothetical protein ALP8811_01937 [Aliiroseovarius pelagivivens]
MIPILQHFQHIFFLNRVPRVALIGAQFTLVQTALKGGNEQCRQFC